MLHVSDELLAQVFSGLWLKLVEMQMFSALSRLSHLHIFELEITVRGKSMHGAVLQSAS